MRTSDRRPRLGPAKAAGPRKPRRDSAARQKTSPATRDTRDLRPLLDRILDTPHLDRVVPQLQPQVLQRIVESCGLEDCGELVALATPGQLSAVFDIDLWRADQPGLDEQFDAGRFGVWLEVLVECGAAVAAQKLVAMDVDLMSTALAEHVRVFDAAAAAPPVPIDGEEIDAVLPPGEVFSCDVGGYRVVARHADSWDAIVALLIALDAEHHDYFHRVMRGCRSRSNSRPEVDGLDDLLLVKDQAMFDLAVGRERRREQTGYATPAHARAFLQMSRQLRVGHDAEASGNPIARAYFRALEETTLADADTGSQHLLAASGVGSAPEAGADAGAALVDALLEAGILPQPPRALLEGSREQAPRLARMQAHMQFVRDRDPGVYSTRSHELAYLANTMVAGCSIQARPLTLQESSHAAIAVCNLGLENWSRQHRQSETRGVSLAAATGPALPDDFLLGHDLVSVFQVGWAVLHDDVCMYAAERLIAVLTRVRLDDREIQSGIDALRREMKKHWQAGAPWQARDALDVLTILDMPAWATLLGLIDEYPVIHAGLSATRGSRIRAVSATAFEFISENSQIASIHEFLRVLPDTLRQ